MEINEYEKWGKSISRRKVTIEGQEAGEVELIFNYSKGRVSISGVSLKPEWKGKGHGKELYKKLGAELAEQGIILCSDESRTEDAERVWKSLMRDGYAKVSNAPRDPNQPIYEFIPGNQITEK